MLFNSYDFLFGLLPVTLWAFHRARRHSHRRAAIVLVLASFIFYGGWYAPYLLVFIPSILTNYTLGQAIADTDRSEAVRRNLLRLGVVLNLGLLGWFKYMGWMVDSLGFLIGKVIPFPEISLPIGISFYTFQQLAYLFDARAGKVGKDDLVDYALFVSFFPQLIAGPIVHHRDLLPQLVTGRGPDDTDRAVGLTIFAVGLAKKVLIADTLAPYGDVIFEALDPANPPTFWTAWTGIVAYHFQLYFDFSGYSDMAVGLGRLFGVKLPANFEAPYRCVTVTDFWRRWHLTLTAFFRDYVYIPLGGNRGRFARRVRNNFLTILLAGIWHGAGFTYLVWGGMMGGYVVVQNLWARVTGGGLPDTWWGVALQRTLTWFALMMSWVVFRSHTMNNAGVVYRSVFQPLEVGWGAPPPIVWLAFAVLTVVVLTLPTVQQWMRFYPPTIDTHRIDEKQWSDRWSWRPTQGWAIAMGLLLFACLPFMERANAFLYWNF